MSIKNYALAGFALAAAHLAAVPAMAADRVVTVVNKTRFSIVELYGSNHGTNSWEEDVLGEDELPRGSSVDVDFDDGTGACMYDFLAVFDDGDQVKQENVNVCKIGTFTFN